MAQVETTVQRPWMMPKLLEAAMEGNNHVLTELLKLEEDHSDQTALTIEPSVGNEQHKLLQSATFMGNTVLHILCLCGHNELVIKVCKKDGSLLRARNKMRETPMHCAAKAQQWGAILVLLELARNEGELVLKKVIRERNCHGETALHEAARHNDAAIIKELINVDSELAYEIDKYGVSALHVAIARGEKYVVNMMLENLPGRNIRVPPEQRTSPEDDTGTTEETHVQMPASCDRSFDIHLAASIGHVDVVEIFLEKDISLAYVQASDGSFPVHVAALTGHADVVLLLMRMCLDSGDLLDSCGRNFLHVAAEENKHFIFDKLFGGINVRANYRPLWRQTLQRMIKTTDNEGNTPLHVAAEKGNISVMHPLLVYLMIEVYGRFHDIRNRKDLTSFDISMIEVKARTGNSSDMQDCIEEYIDEIGPILTYLWIYDVMMRSSEGNSTSFGDQLQLIGLGAVLIITVAFAAAFTLPGGYDSNGSPQFVHKYLFKAFILANTLAFLQSFFCVIFLMAGGLGSFGIPTNNLFSCAISLFSGGARCMVLTFGLGLYLVLAPVIKGVSILILSLTIASVMLVDVTPKVLREINMDIFLFGNCWKSSKKYERKYSAAASISGVLHFLLPFFTFILAFLR